VVTAGGRGAGGVRGGAVRVMMMMEVTHVVVGRGILCGCW